jgi:hypothetical protein
MVDPRVTLMGRLVPVDADKVTSIGLFVWGLLVWFTRKCCSMGIVNNRDSGTTV